MRRLRAWFVRLGGLFNDLFNKGRSDQDIRRKRWTAICRCTSTTTCVQE